MMLVLVFLALFAAMIVPDLAHQVAGRKVDKFYADLKNFAAEARETAISTRQTVELQATGNSVSLMAEPSIDQTSTNNPQPLGWFDNNTDQLTQNNQPVTQETQIRQLTFPSGIQADSFEQGNQPCGASDFKLMFYSDGTTDGGGIELSGSGPQKALDITQDGSVTLYNGSLPDHTQDSWPAGTYLQRNATTP
jgi:Tfp pilus assembly protein FimT